VDTYYHWLPSQHIGEVSELDEIGKARNNPQPRKKGVNGITANPLIILVPRDGIEPPTRGFSAQDSIVSENCVIPTH
jgi:hypothetical protein